ncbi:MAG: hypothetical protein Q9220_000808 [cf. Caloplaca sp. 1 TL-2023]
MGNQQSASNYRQQPIDESTSSQQSTSNYQQQPIDESTSSQTSDQSPELLLPAAKPQDSPGQDQDLWRSPRTRKPKSKYNSTASVRRKRNFHGSSPLSQSTSKDIQHTSQDGAASATTTTRKTSEVHASATARTTRRHVRMSLPSSLEPSKKVQKQKRNEYIRHKGRSIDSIATAKVVDRVSGSRLVDPNHDPKHHSGSDLGYNKSERMDMPRSDIDMTSRRGIEGRTLRSGQRDVLDHGHPIAYAPSQPPNQRAASERISSSVESPKPGTADDIATVHNVNANSLFHEYAARSARLQEPEPDNPDEPDGVGDSAMANDSTTPSSIKPEASKGPNPDYAHLFGYNNLPPTRRIRKAPVTPQRPPLHTAKPPTSSPLGKVASPPTFSHPHPFASSSTRSAQYHKPTVIDLTEDDDADDGIPLPTYHQPSRRHLFVLPSPPPPPPPPPPQTTLPRLLTKPYHPQMKASDRICYAPSSHDSDHSLFSPAPSSTNATPSPDLTPTPALSPSPGPSQRRKRLEKGSCTSTAAAMAATAISSDGVEEEEMVERKKRPRRDVLEEHQVLEEGEARNGDGWCFVVQMIDGKRKGRWVLGL